MLVGLPIDLCDVCLWNVQHLSEAVYSCSLVVKQHPHWRPLTYLRYPPICDGRMVIFAMLYFHYLLYHCIVNGIDAESIIFIVL